MQERCTSSQFHWLGLVSHDLKKYSLVSSIGSIMANVPEICVAFASFLAEALRMSTPCNIWSRMDLHLQNQAIYVIKAVCQKDFFKVDAILRAPKS